MPRIWKILYANEQMAVGDFLGPQGEDGIVYATLQSDGNFVLYGIDGPIGDPGPIHAIWASGLSDGTRVAMQGDGNLVVYHGDTDDYPRWASGTSTAIGNQVYARVSNSTTGTDPNVYRPYLEVRYGDSFWYAGYSPDLEHSSYVGDKKIEAPSLRDAFIMSAMSHSGWTREQAEADFDKQMQAINNLNGKEQPL